MTQQPHSPTATRPTTEQLFSGRGEMRGRFRTFEWSATPLSPVGNWPHGLRSIATTILASAFPNIVLWGPELIQLYNDGYREVMGAKHPSGLGIPTRECWPEAWDFNEPLYQRVFEGETIYFEDVLIPIARYGTLEDVYFTISYSPIQDDDARVGGVLVTLLETTARVEARQLEIERGALLEQMQLERNRLGSLFKHSPSFLAVLRGPEHVVELTNDTYDQLVGYRHVLRRPLAEALPEAVEQGFIALLDNVLATGEPYTGREVPVLLTRTRGAEPEQRFVDFIYQPLVETDGTRSGVVVHGADVTLQVLARQEVERLLAASERDRQELDTLNARLKDSEARLRDVFDQAPMAVAVLTGRDHVYTIVSPAYTRYIANRPLIGRALRDVIPEAGGQVVADLMDGVFDTGEPVMLREQVVPLDRDGDGQVEDYIFDISYQPLRNADGRVYAITSLSLDVTEQVRARKLSEEASRAVERSRAELEQVFSQAPVAIAVLEGPELRFTLSNSAYDAMVGRSGLVGKTVQEALPEFASEDIFRLLDEVFVTGIPFVANELPLTVRRMAMGVAVEAFFNLVYQPLVDTAGAVYAIVAIAVDVTDQVHSRRTVEQLLDESEATRRSIEHANAQLEEQQVELELTNQQLQDSAAELEAQAEELQAQADELEEQTIVATAANQAKSTFLATMSHELRTPLNAIAGYADLLLEGVRGALTDLQRADVERMRRSGKHLLSLINDILNYAKLDVGRVEFQLVQTHLCGLLEGLGDLVGPQLAAKTLAFSNASCDESIQVLVDPDKVRQILLNLVSNAVKFTEPHGAIAVSSDADERQVRIHVRDTGRGIPTEQLDRIFDPFVQVDRHLTLSSQQGVGLGLAISRDLARGMGGELIAASKVGQGSTFTLVLPRSVP